jgi:hypothetical protein
MTEQRMCTSMGHEDIPAVGEAMVEDLPSRYPYCEECLLLCDPPRYWYEEPPTWALADELVDPRATIRRLKEELEFRTDERDALRAGMKYLRACAHLFPHINTDRDHEAVGLADDEPGAWCLGCTVGATADQLGDFDRELLGDDDYDEGLSNARARQWIDEYESRDVEEAANG